MTKGFTSSYKYGEENIVESVKEIGFRQAGPNEEAPKLTISQNQYGYFTNINIKLNDVGGKLLSEYFGRHRTGFPTESVHNENQKVLVFRYLLHGNFIQKIFASQAPSSELMPVYELLRESTYLIDPNESVYDKIEREMIADNKDKIDVVSLELVEEKKYSPPMQITGRGVKDSVNWPDILEDRERERKCGEFLKRTKRNYRTKTQYTVYEGTFEGRSYTRGRDKICTDEFIWLFLPPPKRFLGGILKYDTEGNRVYRVAFNKPVGKLLKSTVKSEGGYLYFEWWITSSCGIKEFCLTRKATYRFKEPI